MHEIRTEQDVTGEAAKALRESCGLSQKAFWSAVGLTQSGGCRYERGNRLPKPSCQHLIQEGKNPAEQKERQNKAVIHDLERREAALLR